MKSQMLLIPSGIEAMMHGVKMFRFSGRRCTAVYTDDTEETATIPEVLQVSMRNYFAYQNENGAPCDAPNSFALVSAIQAHRPAIHAEP